MIVRQGAFALPGAGSAFRVASAAGGIAIVDVLTWIFERRMHLAELAELLRRQLPGIEGARLEAAEVVFGQWRRRPMADDSHPASSSRSRSRSRWWLVRVRVWVRVWVRVVPDHAASSRSTTRRRGPARAFAALVPHTAAPSAPRCRLRNAARLVATAHSEHRRFQAVAAVRRANSTQLPRIWPSRRRDPFLFRPGRTSRRAPVARGPAVLAGRRARPWSWLAGHRRTRRVR